MIPQRIESIAAKVLPARFGQVPDVRPVVSRVDPRGLSTPRHWFGQVDTGGWQVGELVRMSFLSLSIYMR